MSQTEGVIVLSLTFALTLSLLALYCEAVDRRNGLLVVPMIGILFIYMVLIEPYSL